MRKEESEQILDKARQILNILSQAEIILGTELNSLCSPLCDIINVVADATGTMWDDELWGKVYNYDIPISSLMASIDEYVKQEKEKQKEEEAKPLDQE